MDKETDSTGFEITVIQAGSGKLYSDEKGYFYRMEKPKSTSGEIKMFAMRCTYENCGGQAHMRRIDDRITLFHSNKHSCLPNSFFQNVTALRNTILKRCSNEWRKSVKTIFFEETSSYKLSAAVRAALSLPTLLPSLERARKKRGTSRAFTNMKSQPNRALEYAGDGLKQFVFINEDGIIEEEGIVRQCQVVEEAVDLGDELIESEIVMSAEEATLSEVHQEKKDTITAALDSRCQMPLVQVSGKEGSAVYTDDNRYFYHKLRHMISNGSTDTWSMTCTNDKCLGNAIMELKNNVLTLRHVRRHSCEPIPGMVDVMVLKERILERCELDPITPLKQIYQEETTSAECAPEVGSMLSFDEMESIMLRMRLKSTHPTWSHQLQ